MRKPKVAVALVLVALVSVLGIRGIAQKAKAPGKVTVALKDGTGKALGTAVISPAKQGVSIALNLHDLTPGEHAIHIHAVAKCEGPAFTTAGGHFNPDMKKHGLQNPDGPHAGDMNNFTATAKGTAKATVTDTRVDMGDDAHSIFANGGTALVVHAKADDMKTDPAGAAGDRIGCGTITK